MADLTVRATQPVSADSFVKPSFVQVPADPVAQAAFQSGTPHRLQVLIDAGPIVLDGDSHSAFWVYQSPDGLAWSHLVSLTDSRDVDVSWDGRAVFLKIIAAVSFPVALGISVKTFPARSLKG